MGRPDPRQAPMALAEDEGPGQTPMDHFVEEAPLIDDHGQVGARRAVGARDALPARLHAPPHRLHDVGVFGIGPAGRSAVCPPTCRGPLESDREVTRQNADALERVLGLAEGRTRRRGVRARVFFVHPQLPVQAHRFRQRHEGAVPADPTEPVAVGARQEIDVGGFEHLRKGQVARALIGGVFHVLLLMEEPVRPRQFHDVAVECARQHFAVRGVFDNAAEVVDAVRDQVGEARAVVDHFQAACRVAEVIEVGVLLLVLRRDLGGVEHHAAVFPRQAQRVERAVFAPEPLLEIALHRFGEIRRAVLHRRFLDPFPSMTRLGLKCDDALALGRRAYEGHQLSEECPRLLAPDLRRVRLRIPSTVVPQLQLIRV